MVNNLPILFDFPAHYPYDGMKPFVFYFYDDETGSMVDLTGSKVFMKLKIPDYRGKGAVVFQFTTETEDPESKLDISTLGTLKFPRILEWDLKDNNYMYELKITDSFNFPRTFIKGFFPIKQFYNMNELLNNQRINGITLIADFSGKDTSTPFAIPITDVEEQTVINWRTDEVPLDPLHRTYFQKYGNVFATMAGEDVDRKSYVPEYTKTMAGADIISITFNYLQLGFIYII